MSQFRVDADLKGHLNLTDSQCQQTITCGKLQYLTFAIKYWSPFQSKCYPKNSKTKYLHFLASIVV